MKLPTLRKLKKMHKDAFASKEKAYEKAILEAFEASVKFPIKLKLELVDESDRSIIEDDLAEKGFFVHFVGSSLAIYADELCIDAEGSTKDAMIKLALELAEHGDVITLVPSEEGGVELAAAVEACREEDPPAPEAEVDVDAAIESMPF